MKEVSIKTNLNERQQQFCHYFVYGKPDEFRSGHGGKSYAEAYDKSFELEANTCYSNAHRLLRNAEISDFIEATLAENGLNSILVNARLHDIIFNGNDSDALQAIREYNRIRGRLKGSYGIGRDKPAMTLQQQAIEDGLI